MSFQWLHFLKTDLIWSPVTKTCGLVLYIFVLTMDVRLLRGKQWTEELFNSKFHIKKNSDTVAETGKEHVFHLMVQLCEWSSNCVKRTWKTPINAFLYHPTIVVVIDFWIPLTTPQLMLSLISVSPCTTPQSVQYTAVVFVL